MELKKNYIEEKCAESQSKLNRQKNHQQRQQVLRGFTSSSCFRLDFHMNLMLDIMLIP